MESSRNYIEGLLYSSVVGIVERIGISLLLLFLFSHGFSCFSGCFWLGIVFALSEGLSRALEHGIEKNISSKKVNVILAKLRIIVSSIVFVLGVPSLIFFLVGLGLYWLGFAFSDMVIGVSMVLMLSVRSLLGWVLARSGLYRVVLGSSVLGIATGFFLALFTASHTHNVVIVLGSVYLVGLIMLIVTGVLAGIVSRRYSRLNIKFGKCDVPCVVSSLKYLVVLLSLIVTSLDPVGLLGLIVLYDCVQRLVLLLVPKFGVISSVLHLLSIGIALLLGPEYAYVVGLLGLLSIVGLGSQSPLRALLSV